MNDEHTLIAGATIQVFYTQCFWPEAAEVFDGAGITSLENAKYDFTILEQCRKPHPSQALKDDANNGAFSTTPLHAQRQLYPQRVLEACAELETD